ncbi:MAG: malto-oligosyltrehalose synthase, partial [Actinobacteria bacterium]|nr:malto-oligosyltrehalose synthase [Actinomycetota bacterium]
PSGTYRPLFAAGSRAGHLIAFCRSGTVISVAPRLVLALNGRWDDTILELPAGSWANALTGAEFTGEIAVAGLLCSFPVAVLERLDA